MIEVRKASDRGTVDHGWLLAKHSFSFGEYFDPKFVGFRKLVVINEDVIQPSQGFGTHGHRDMEILTYMISGTISHKDSMGNEEHIKRGEIQYMCAGKGVRHSEYNASPNEKAHLLQIWIEPNVQGAQPTYTTQAVKDLVQDNGLILFASEDGNRGSVKLNQDARVFLGIWPGPFQVERTIQKGRGFWIQVVKGKLKVNRVLVKNGDGIFGEDLTHLVLECDEGGCEFLFFDLP